MKDNRKIDLHCLRRTQVKRAILSGLFISTATFVIGFSNVSYANVSPTISSNIDRYDAHFFMAYEPQTLYDILEKVPGANSLLIAMNSAGENRGFGSAGDQILINNKRVSGKENNIEKELANIQAQDVDYIELIRGTRSDLDVQSNGLVINVLLKKDIDSSILWSMGSVKSTDLALKPNGSVIYSDGIGDLKYRFGLSHVVSPTEFTAIDQFTSPDQRLIHTNTRVREHWYKQDQFSAKLEYLHSDKTSLQLNGLYEKVYLDSVGTITIDNWITAEQENKSRVYDWGKDKWEISGDISHVLDEDNQFKLLFISNKADADDKIWQVSLSEDQSTELDYQIPRKYLSSENVLRGNWKHQQDPRHSFDSGVEIAINKHDENMQFIRQSGSDYHSTEFNKIKETRYEAFLQYNFMLSSDINFQSGLVYERSTMAVATDLSVTSDTKSEVKSQSSRTFSYLKPRVNIRYDINDIYQMRFNYQRTVSQLALDDFVPWFNSYESRLEETNAQLKPEVRDELSLSFEKQWQVTDGSITLTPYYHKISDLRTEVLLAERSGDGNVESGKEYGLKLASHFGLEAIGLDNTLISADYTWRDSQMIHPFTGQNAPIERVSKNEWNVTLNQNELLPGLAFNLALAKKSRYHFHYFDYQGQVNSEMTAEASFDYKINQYFKVRLKGYNLLDNKYTVYKERHTGLFTQSDVLRQEQRSNEYGPKFTLTLTGQF